MSNKQRIENKLKALITALEEEGDEANRRVLDAVEDCLADDISDKDRTYNYTYCRKQANRFGYGAYLPKSGARDADPALADAIAYIEKTITTFVQAGVHHCPDVLDIMRPKKNKKGILRYTEETLIKTLVASCVKWHTEAYKNKQFSGSVDEMSTIGTTETGEEVTGADSEE